MLAIPSALQKQFEEYLRNKPITISSQGAYKKWLRYYLDFCRNHNFPTIRKESLPYFIRKLQEKKQAKAQQEQAVKAITLYYETLKTKGLSNKKPAPQTSSPLSREVKKRVSGLVPAPDLEVKIRLVTVFRFP